MVVKRQKRTLQLSVEEQAVSTDPMLTPAQLRAARALLDWSRQDLAKRSGTSHQAIQGFESRGADSKGSSMLKWRRACELAGVEFIYADANGGPGVRLKA